MYLEPNKERLSHLRLTGYPLLTQLVFCPNCDFQYPPQSAGGPWCPVCERSLHVTRVTPDLVELVTGVRVPTLDTSERRRWFMNARQHA